MFLLVCFSCSQFCRITPSLSYQDILPTAYQEKKKKHLVISIKQIDSVRPSANRQERFDLGILSLWSNRQDLQNSPENSWFLLCKVWLFCCWTYLPLIKTQPSIVCMWLCYTASIFWTFNVYQKIIVLTNTIHCGRNTGKL